MNIWKIAVGTQFVSIKKNEKGKAATTNKMPYTSQKLTTYWKNLDEVQQIKREK